MILRLAEMEDRPAILAVFAAARAFMASHGNPTQWGTDRPAPALIDADLAARRLQVLTGEDGVIHGVFTLIVGPYHAYEEMEEGAWRWQETYGTIHRLASDGALHGVLPAVLAACEREIGYLRADTHPDNKVMQHLLTKYGFQYAGIIRADDGTIRWAYERKEA